MAGKITRKVETIDGAIDTYDYTYDTNGRLVEVKKNNSVVETYNYDANGNRIMETNVFKGFSNRPYTFSAEDHLITAGPDTYQFDLDGFLTRKTTLSGIMTTSYSSRGELLSATLPGGTIVTYDHDPMGRRISKRINGNITEKYLWANATTLLAVYDGSDNLVMRFNYANGRMAVSMTYNGSSYYLLYDQIGSLRAVSDATGNIVKRIDYDSFGSIINDTNPLFKVPFGFAGGLHDRDTNLVRFGARDYDPAIGRWTAKDPIDFDGGDTNLYGYVLNDPVNWVDPKGLEIRVYSSNAFGVSGLNHAFVYSTETGRVKGTHGSMSSSYGGNGGGNLQSPYVIIPLPLGLSEFEFMDRIENAKGWDNWVWIPWVNDCHTDLKNAFKQAGVSFPGAPNGRIDFDDIIKNSIQSKYNLFLKSLLYKFGYPF